MLENNSKIQDLPNQSELKIPKSNDYLNSHLSTSVKLRAPQSNILLVFVIIALILTLVINGYLFFLTKSLTNQLDQLTTDKQKYFNQFNSPQNQNLLQQTKAVIEKTETLGQILEERIKWTNLLEIINQESLRNIKYTDINISQDGLLELSAEATDFETFGKAMRAWESSDLVEKTVLGNFDKTLADEAQGEPSKVLFDLTVTLKPSSVGISDSSIETQTPTEIDPNTNPPTP